MTTKPIVHDIYEPQTGTWQYIVADPVTKIAVIIDSVLDFDPATATITTTTADTLLSLAKEKQYKVEKLLETHVHADHLTAASYLQAQIVKEGAPKPDICIGKRIKQVQDTFAKRYGIPEEQCVGMFDQVFGDDETFTIGNLTAKAVHLPGHTPDHLGYVIGSE